MNFDVRRYPKVPRCYRGLGLKDIQDLWVQSIAFRFNIIIYNLLCLLNHSLKTNTL